MLLKLGTGMSEKEVTAPNSVGLFEPMSSILSFSIFSSPSSTCFTFSSVLRARGNVPYIPSALGDDGGSLTDSRRLLE